MIMITMITIITITTMITITYMVLDVITTTMRVKTISKLISSVLTIKSKKSKYR
jgi:hypothetical protein